MTKDVIIRKKQGRGQGAAGFQDVNTDSSM